LKKLGAGGFSRKILLISSALVFLCWVLFLARLTLKREGKRLTPLERSWRKWLKKLAKRGYPKEPHEGPIAFSLRLGEVAPEIRAPAKKIAIIYAQSRYGGKLKEVDDHLAIELMTAFKWPRKRKKLVAR
jgi:hypothetical protein